MGILIIEMLTSENPLRGENRRESEYLTKHKVSVCVSLVLRLSSTIR